MGASEATKMTGYLLELYVTGETARARVAMKNLRRVCDSELGAGAYEVVIVDVLQDPERAEAERVLATPTLIRRFPPPVCRVIGDLSDSATLKTALELGLQS
jgi:circadian clock protein KaiB